MESRSTLAPFFTGASTGRHGRLKWNWVARLAHLLLVLSSQVLATDYHLAPRGSLACDYGVQVLWDDSNPGALCVAAAMVIIKRIIGAGWYPETIAWDEGQNGKTCGSGAWGDWGDVQPGCSIGTTARSLINGQLISPLIFVTLGVCMTKAFNKLSSLIGQTAACLRLPHNFDLVTPACLRLQSQARNEATMRLSAVTV